jgi:5-methylthioadenosine/S-adenosylhomocysteine deaminase
VVDGRGKIVLPGFVDLHNHLWQALIRGCAGDNELNGWLGRCVLPFYRNAPVTDADGYAGARLASLDVVSTGITTVTDWSHDFNADFARGNLRALDESKLRFVFSYNGTTNTALQDEIRRVKREVIDPNPLAHLQIGTHPSTGDYPSLVDTARVLRDAQTAADHLKTLLPQP